jgi:hypothetical protein
VIRRPIPQRAAEAFYHETFDRNIPHDIVHSAVMESHEWHRRWVQQEETGHTMPHHDNDFLVTYIAERELACRNPGLPEDEMEEELEADFKVEDFIMMRKRGRGCVNIQDENDQEEDECEDEESNDEQELDFQPPTSKQRHSRKPLLLTQKPAPVLASTTTNTTSPINTYTVNNNLHHTNINKNNENEKATPSQPLLARPKPVRAADLVNNLIPNDNEIPEDIVSQVLRSLSPLTIATTSESSDDSSHYSTSEHNHQTVAEIVSAPALIEDDDHQSVVSMKPMSNISIHDIQHDRDGIYHALAVNAGETSSPAFQASPEAVQEHYARTGNDAAASASSVKGERSWSTLTKPTFLGCLGENDAGDPLYILGRMSFDMFSPTALV